MKRLTAFLLTLGIIVAMVANSADFFFRQPYYEYWDLAANSLSVLRAKHFAELYGSYSRWGFHHPGPVFFYVQAFGEWLFYDLLHLSPAPFNAQTLANLVVTTSFFVAALSVFARWLSEGARRWFVPLALAVAVLHFGAVSRMPSYDMLLGPSAFSSAWTAHSLVFPFLCMLTAAASVAAGRGEDLPLLALADGFLIHAHIAEPLFVGPITLLAYTGLLVTTLRRGPAADAAPATAIPVWRRAARGLGAAWRSFPRRHAVAVAILAVFALPLVLDLFLGEGSNFHAVLTHLRTHHGKHKSFARSLFYLVQFGAYRPYVAHRNLFTRFDKAGAYAYLWYHRKIYATWIVAILAVVWIAAVRPALAAWKWRRERNPAAPTSQALPDGMRFLVWAGAFLLLAVPLTLCWGIIQDGDMFYYSGWCNFAIYYFGLLIVVAGVSSRLAAWAGEWRNGALLTHPVWTGAERFAPAGLLVLVCVLHADRFRVRDPAPETNRAMHESNVRVVQDAIARNPHGIKVFDCPFFVWPAVTSVALEMARQGQPFMVVNGLSAEHFSVPFGMSYAWQPTAAPAAHIMELWRFRRGKLWRFWESGTPKWYVPLGKDLERQLADARREMAAHGEVAVYPLLDHVELRVGVPIVDPRDSGAVLDFRRGGRGADAVLYGFGDPEAWGTWNTGRSGGLRLRGGQVAAADNVEISLDAHPFLAPDEKLTSQRLNLAVNGTLLGPETELAGDAAVVYTVPGALWNRTFGQSAGAALEFGFPDAESPAAVEPGEGEDTRQLGVGLYGIRFRAVAAVVSQPTLDLNQSDGGAELDFKRGGNARAYEGDGWYGPEAWGTWSSGHASELHFHSTLVDGTRDVEITLDIHGAMDTDSGIKGQRIRASLGDVPFDRERAVTSTGRLVLTVPAAVWNAAVAADADAVLQLDFPDAVSPARLDPTGREQDQRQLAIGVERIGFRAVPAPVVTAR